MSFRKNRNLYSQILLQMLQRRQLKEPFTKPPDYGKLPTIPAYMVSNSALLSAGKNYHTRRAKNEFK